ncbi:hypothetical protein Tco_0965423 [Tanacetum coccineum]
MGIPHVQGPAKRVQVEILYMIFRRAIVIRKRLHYFQTIGLNHPLPRCPENTEVCISEICLLWQTPAVQVLSGSPAVTVRYNLSLQCHHLSLQGWKQSAAVECRSDALSSLISSRLLPMWSVEIITLHEKDARIHGVSKTLSGHAALALVWCIWSSVGEGEYEGVVGNGSEWEVAAASSSHPIRCSSIAQCRIGLGGGVVKYRWVVVLLSRDHAGTCIGSGMEILAVMRYEGEVVGVAADSSGLMVKSPPQSGQ